MIDEKIKKFIKETLIGMSVYIDEKEIEVEHPVVFEHGDYSTNIAMIHAKKTGENPIEFANKITKELIKNKPKEIEKIEVAGNGFINFYFSKDFFIDSIKEVLKKEENYGKSNFLKGQKTIVEYTDANPFKEFHIGHLMSNTIGESISRIIEFCGAKVKRANYQGDIGAHIAKAVWGIYQNKNNLPKDGLDPKDKAKFLGMAYALGAKNYDTDENIKKEIEEINRKIYSDEKGEIKKLYEWGRKTSLDYFEMIYKRLGTKFDYYFFESKIAKSGKKIVNEYLKRGLFEESEGAIIFKGEKYGLHTRVFQNSKGLPTYEGKELGLSKMKYEKYSYDKSLIVTGNDINDYFDVLLKVMSFIFPKLAERTVHVGHGMLKLPTGKMGSRTGEIITAEFLIDEVFKRVRPQMEESGLPEEIRNEVAEKVSISAVKYSILKQKAGKDIIFDIDKSVSFEGDSGPYLQYTCVRAKSVIEKAKRENKKLKAVSEKKEITNLERMIYRFPEIIKRAGEEYSPHYVVIYLIELSAEFNTYYAVNKIIGNSKESQYRLAMTKAVSIILENGLKILSIKVPERM
ncbi:MAG: arginine--tRNA ligase [Patescibacteria group bacterium]